MIDGITRRHFHHFLAAGAAAAVVGPDIKLAMALETAAIAWTSDHPHLSGNYAPIGYLEFEAETDEEAARLARAVARSDSRG